MAPVGNRTHDLPHTVASNMVKVSNALNHSATAAARVILSLRVNRVLGSGLGLIQNLNTKGPATRNDFVNDIVDDARADAIFATLKTIVDDGSSTISSTISLRVAGPLNPNPIRLV